MKQIGVYDAKTHLTQLLDEVERGETIEITRHGHPVARVIPVHEEPERLSVAEAIEEMHRLREEIATSHPGVTYDVKALINEGRR
jgi:prevent-host-death family protein